MCNSIHQFTQLKTLNTVGYPCNSHITKKKQPTSVGKEQSDLDEILRELLGESHTTTSTTTRKEKVGEGVEDSFVRERQQYTNPDGSTTTIEKRKYKSPNITENVTINKVFIEMILQGHTHYS